MCGCGKAYDDTEIFRVYRDASEMLFNKVDAILSYPRFLFIADEEVEPGAPVSLPSERKSMPSKGAFVVRREAKRGAAKAQRAFDGIAPLVRGMLDVLAGKFGWV